MIPTESRQSEGVLIFRILFQVRRIIQTAFVRLGDNNAKLNSLWVGLVVERSLKYASGKYDFVFRGRVVRIDSHWRHAPTSITHTHTRPPIHSRNSLHLVTAQHAELFINTQTTQTSAKAADPAQLLYHSDIELLSKMCLSFAPFIVNLYYYYQLPGYCFHCTNVLCHS